MPLCPKLALNDNCLIYDASLSLSQIGVVWASVKNFVKRHTHAMKPFMKLYVACLSLTATFAPIRS